MIRLDRLLCNLGFCTRSKVQKWARVNSVTVNGKASKSLQDTVFPDQVLIHGKPLDLVPPVHLVLYKPIGIVCSHVEEQKSNPTFLSLLPERFSQMHPTLSVAGRLDKIASGLLIISQSGELVQKIISPQSAIQKIYEVTTEDPFKGNEEEVFESGELILRGETHPCLPAKFKIMDASKNLAQVILYEGKYHQIRRMLGALGHRVKNLHRVQIGQLRISDLNLEVGQWQPLSPAEVELITSNPNTTNLNSTKQ